MSDYSNGRIEKFSPGVPGWKQTNINGFGDQYNVLGVTNIFNGKLYAGVTKWGAPPQIWQSGNGKNWSMVSTPGNTISSTTAAVLDLISFNGQMYASLGWNAGSSPNPRVVIQVEMVDDTRRQS